jgi:hypothetical protein
MNLPDPNFPASFSLAAFRSAPFEFYRGLSFLPILGGLRFLIFCAIPCPSASGGFSLFPHPPYENQKRSGCPPAPQNLAPASSVPIPPLGCRASLTSKETHGTGNLLFGAQHLPSAAWVKSNLRSQE